MDTAEDHLYKETMQEDGGAAVVAKRQGRWGGGGGGLGAGACARDVARNRSRSEVALKGEPLARETAFQN